MDLRGGGRAHSASRVEAVAGNGLGECRLLIGVGGGGDCEG